jgi:hypothetical protein
MVSAEELASFQKGCRKNTIGKQKQQLYNIQQEHHIAALCRRDGVCPPDTTLLASFRATRRNKVRRKTISKTFVCIEILHYRSG